VVASRTQIHLKVEARRGCNAVKNKALKSRFIAKRRATLRVSITIGIFRPIGTTGVWRQRRKFISSVGQRQGSVIPLKIKALKSRFIANSRGF
jgi:hypothetical protein